MGTMKNRIVWIDLLRGFCMMLILWFHTEVYYAGHTVIPYDLYVVNFGKFVFDNGSEQDRIIDCKYSDSHNDTLLPGIYSIPRYQISS